VHDQHGDILAAPRVTLVVHIGYPKTGSTWLQQRVFPHVPGVRFGNADPRLRALMTGLVLEETFEPEPLRAALGGGALLYSDESICGDMFAEPSHGFRNAERLHAAAPDARIVVFVRRQQEMIRSLYAQYVNMGGTRPLRDFVDGRAPGCLFTAEHLEYDRLLDAYARLFGPERVRVLVYERLRADPASFAVQVLEAMGAEAPDRLRVSWPNRSLSPAGLALLRGWNRAFRASRFNERPWLALPGGRRVRSVLQQRLDPVLRRLSAAGPLPDANGYAESNRRLQAYVDEPLERWGYTL
jgi:hypothetical protein